MSKTFDVTISIIGKVDKSLGDALKQTEKQTDSLGGKLKSVLPAAAAAAAAAIGKAFLEAVKLGDRFNETMNQLSASTGTYGSDLEELKGIALDVYGDNFGQSVDDVSQALATLVQQTDLSGEALESAAKSGLMLRDTFGYDIAESTRTADTLMRNFGVSAEEAYGLMAVGAQNGADKSGELLDTLNEYSSQYAALGMSADEFTQSLIAGAESGAWSIDKVGDAVKEFNLRAKDGSATTVAAFDAIGLNAEEMQQKFAQGGQSAHDAFFETVSALNSMTDPVAKNTAAVNLFGTQFEDLQANVLPALSSISGASLDAQGALQGIADVRYDSIGSALQGAARQVEAGMLPIFSNAASQVLEQMNQLGAVLGPKLTGIFEQIGPPLQQAFDTLIPAIGQIAQVVLPPLMDMFAALLPVIIQVATIVGGVLATAFAFLAPVISVVASVLTTVFTIIGQLLGLFTSLISQILSQLAPAFEWLAGPLSSVQGFLNGVASAAQSVISWFQGVIDKVGEVGAAIANSPVGQFVGGVGSAIGGLLGFRTGGFTTGPYIAGEDPRYPNEAVISFNPAYRAQNLRYWAMAGHMLGASPSVQAAASTGGGGTSISVGGITFAPNITVRGNASKDDFVAALREVEPDFVDFVVDAIARRTEAAYAI